MYVRQMRCADPLHALLLSTTHDHRFLLQISLEDVERIAGTLGFRTLQRSIVPAAFNANLRSMMQMSYRAAFWTMVKDSTVEPPAQ